MSRRGDLMQDFRGLALGQEAAGPIANRRRQCPTIAPKQAVTGSSFPWIKNRSYSRVPEVTPVGSSALWADLNLR